MSTRLERLAENFAIRAERAKAKQALEAKKARVLAVKTYGRPNDPPASSKPEPEAAPDTERPPDTERCPPPVFDAPSPKPRGRPKGTVPKNRVGWSGRGDAESLPDPNDESAMLKALANVIRYWLGLEPLYGGENLGRRNSKRHEDEDE